MLGTLRKPKEPIVVAARPVGVPDDLKNEDKTHKFFTTRRYPIYYLAITKCGSTFLKNLFYALDHDQLHPDAGNIHDHSDDLLRAHDTPRWMIRRSRYAFTVLRDPVDRFLSMYFDKLYGTGPQNFPELREEIAAECAMDLSPGLNAADHAENCLKLIDWLGRNIANETDIPINPHWRPQMTRVNKLAHMKIGFFTLDGLDWQMPAHLGDVVPDLPAKMAMVRSRNVTRYPVDKSAVATDELRARVRAVYAEDAKKYDTVSEQWAARRDRKEPLLVLDNAPKLHVLTTHRFNINALVIPKVGCSYVRNLFYALDHGRANDAPSNIDNDGSLLHRRKTKTELEAGVNFLVLRDPVARFFSLYFDKVWGHGDSQFPWIAKKLSESRRFREGQDLTAEQHHDNCCRLLGYLESRFEEKPVEELNAHWRPQFVKATEAREFGFAPILLEDLERQLRVLADGQVRGLDEAFGLVSYRNESAKPVDMNELASSWVLDRIHTLYAEDMALYERVRAGWNSESVPPAL